MPRSNLSTLRRLLALSAAAACGPVLAHPGHEHSLLNLFDLLHAGGALVLLAACVAGFIWQRQRRAARDE